MATQIQIRRDTAANWTSANPTLAAGEIGFETDQNKFKIGTGTDDWATLAYGGGSGGASGPDLTDINTITTEAGQNLVLTADGGSLELKVDNSAHTALNFTGASVPKIDTGFVKVTNAVVNMGGFSTGQTISPDMDSGTVFYATLTGDADLGNVTNAVDGQSGKIVIQRTGGGGSQIINSYSSAFYKLDTGTTFDPNLGAGNCAVIDFTMVDGVAICHGYMVEK